MLEFLRSWIEGIAISVIIASIFEMILPNGNIKKYIKMILGIYIVFSIISPFVDSETLYSLNISEMLDEYTENISTSSSVTEDSVNSNLNEIYVSTFEDEITSEVENQGYTVISCDVEATFDTESDNAGIEKITIVLGGKENTNEENTISTVEPVEKVEVTVGNTTNENTETEDAISSDDIDELKSYLSDYYEIDENIIYIEQK